MDLSRYRKVSSKDGGEYAGPCYFTGEGEDRFRIFPHHPRFTAPVWFCRGSCVSCPGKISKNGMYKYGFFEEDNSSVVKEKAKTRKRRRTMPTIQEAQGYAKLLDAEVIAYLGSRGISERVARLHRIGKRYGKMLTIPNIISDSGKTICYGIKWRWLPQYQPEGTDSYRFLPGSDPKSIYNYNALRKHHDYVVVVESLLDVLMLETQGVVAVAPFGGGAIWNQNWSKFFDCNVIVNIGDNDEPRVTNGEVWTPGEKYANNRAHLLGMGNSVKYHKVITAFPPDNYKDITDAFQNGIQVKQFIEGVVNGCQNNGIQTN